MIKIIPTIGPITCDTQSLRSLSKYSNIFRLNTSHNNIDWHIKTVKKIHKLNKNIKVLIDIPGVKPRTKNEKNILIKKSSIVVFYYGKKPMIKKANSIYVLLSNPIPQKNLFKKKNRLSVDDGRFSLGIIKLSKKYIITISDETFILKPNKGLNIPNSIYDDNLQEKKYLTFLAKLKKLKYDAIGLSFIQSQNLILKLRKKYPEKLIVSKIENLEGVKNMSSICLHSDVVMIDRGDLAAEIGNENLFDAILKISKVCKSFNKPLMIATENLESMIKNQLPTKSEIFTLGYYKQINVDSIMLSDETSTSKNWKNTVKWIFKFFNSEKISTQKNIEKKESFWNLFRKDLKLPIIIFSKRGKSINNVERLSYFNQVSVFTENNKIKTLCEFKKNIKVYITKKFDNRNLLKFIKENLKINKKKIFKTNNQAIVIYISFPRKDSIANTVTLLDKRDL